MNSVFKTRDLCQKRGISCLKRCILKDALLVGLIRLARAILDKVDVSEYCVKHDVRPLLSSLFNQGLFDRRQPKFVSHASRSAAYGLLWAFAHNDPARVEFMWEQIATLQTQFKPVPVFNYNPSADAKSSTGLVGLRNLGCTCYMNSIIQQFFSVAQLRYGILSVDNQQLEDEPQHPTTTTAAADPEPTGEPTEGEGSVFNGRILISY